MGGVLALAFADIHWSEVPRTGSMSAVLAVLRGLLIAIPLLVLFGGLFMAADAVFSGLVSGLFAVNVEQAVTHLFWIGLWSWITAGFLRQLLFCTIAVDGLGSIATHLDAEVLAAIPTEPHDADAAVLQPVGATADDGVGAVRRRLASKRPSVQRPNGRVAVLGPVELGIVLGLLNLLFLAFVIVQFRYLFGGAELVRVSTSLTYAEYARRGFFELVWVAALLLPIVLTIDWLARLDSPRQSRVYLVLAGVLWGCCLW